MGDDDKLLEYGNAVN